MDLNLLNDKIKLYVQGSHSYPMSFHSFQNVTAMCFRRILAMVTVCNVRWTNKQNSDVYSTINHLSQRLNVICDHFVIDKTLSERKIWSRKKNVEREREKEKIFFTKVKKIYSSFKLYHNRQYSFDDFNKLTQTHQSIFT